MKRDFTIKKYEDLCVALLESDYIPYTVNDYIKCQDNLAKRYVILRHDVDRKPENASKMAELEHSLGIRSTYYFRYPYTFTPQVISQISSLDHEIGYHYEVLSKANGDYEKAIDLFKQELSKFRSLCEIQTISMHGASFSPYDNRDIWKKYDFLNFGIKGEAYLSIEGRNVQYMTETGRSWDGKYSVRDVLHGGKQSKIQTTDDLIALIQSHEEKELYLTVHPGRWAITGPEWMVSNVRELLVNVIKKIIISMRGRA